PHSGFLPGHAGVGIVALLPRQRRRRPPPRDLQLRADRRHVVFPVRPCRGGRQDEAAETAAMSALLEIRNVSRSFGSARAVDGVSFEVQQGELLGLIGPNGAGKSTLFNLVAGVLSPTSGEILLDGRSVTGWKPHAIARTGVARTFQIPKPYRQLSVVENVMMSAFLREKSISGARSLA